MEQGLSFGSGASIDRDDIESHLSSWRRLLFLAPPIDALYDRHVRSARRKQHNLIFASVLIGNLLCLLFESRAGDEVFSVALFLRMGPVTILHLAVVIAIFGQAQRNTIEWLVVGAQVSLVGTVAILGSMIAPPFQDRYFMVAGILPVLANIMLPRRILVASVATFLSVAVFAYVLANFGGSGISETIVFLCLVIAISLAASIQSELSGRRAFLLTLLDKMGTEALRSANAQLHALVRRDGLTGLLNRRGFDEALQLLQAQTMQKGDWLGILMIDIDQFKQLNDTRGHEIGDACLIAIAKTIGAHADRNETVAARYGGEEFAILLSGSDPEEARRHAEELRQLIEELKFCNPGARHGVVTASIGVAAVRSRGPGWANAPSPLALADRALFEAKENGRNRIVFATPVAA